MAAPIIAAIGRMAVTRVIFGGGRGGMLSGMLGVGRRQTVPEPRMEVEDGELDVGRINSALRAGTEQGLFDAAGFLREQANRTVPIDEGTLQRSGGIEVDAGRGEAAVYYDTEYAVAVHEGTDMTFSTGRRAKWLEATMQEQRHEVRQALAKALRQAFSD